MSGFFEIAGVILGVIPILQIALNQVGGRNVKTLLKYQQTIIGFERDLGIEHLKFRTTCEKLLGPLVDEEELTDLLQNYNSDGWKDPELEEKLRGRLGESAYDLYIDAMKHLGEALDNLQKETGLKRHSRKSDSLYDKIGKRLKACLKNSRLHGLLRDIRACNDSLFQLTGVRLELEPTRNNRRSGGDIKKWESLRKLAKGLHQTLQTGLLCDCNAPHVAHLHLGPRSDTGELVCFGILFSRDIKPRHWQETEIRIPQPNGGNPVGSLSTISRIRSTSCASQEATVRTVTFSSEVAEDAITAVESTISAAVHSKIENLCRELEEKGKETGCIGFLDDRLHNKQYYVHSIYPPTILGEEISLNELLARNESTGPHPLTVKLGLRDKYELAVILATSVLQLHSTEWLDKTSWKEDVRFVRPRGNNSLARYAYIQKRFGTRHPSEAPEREQTLAMPAIRNETIFYLGVTLIELSLGHALISFQTDDDLGPDRKRTIVTDYGIAQRLLKDIQEREGERYTNTVNRCINCLFEGIVPSLEDAQFRHAFYQSAVVPLREVRDDFIK